jgi:hypothetical protein
MKNTARPALGPVGDSRHLLPCTVDFVLLREPAPPWGAQAQGGYFNNINYIYIYILFSSGALLQ